MKLRNIWNLVGLLLACFVGFIFCLFYVSYLCAGCFLILGICFYSLVMIFLALISFSSLLTPFLFYSSHFGVDFVLVLAMGLLGWWNFVGLVSWSWWSFGYEEYYYFLILPFPLVARRVTYILSYPSSLLLLSEAGEQSWASSNYQLVIPYSIFRFQMCP